VSFLAVNTTSSLTLIVAVRRRQVEESAGGIAIVRSKCTEQADHDAEALPHVPKGPRMTVNVLNG
jgi:hypothetical protein